MKNKDRQKYYQVAGVTLALISDYPISEHTFNPLIRQFEVSEPGNDMIDIHHHFESPDFSDEIRISYTEVFKNNQFHIFKSATSWIFYYTSLFAEDSINRVIGVANEDFSSMHIYTSDLTMDQYGNGGFNTLTLFNTDQMFFAKILCDRNGAMIHSNGFNINGNGVLFAGISGSGKSTISKILKAHSDDHKILCDDRMFIRNRENGFWIFGNWCYGPHSCASPASMPLKGFMFLEKRSKNRIIELKEKEKIMPRLLQVLVKPLLDKEGWRKYFITIQELMENVSFYTIEFDLSGDIIKEINSFFGE